jgi:hypothetical protein
MRTEYISAKEVLNQYIMKMGTDDTSYFDEDVCKIFIDEGMDELTTSSNLEVCIDHITVSNPKTGKFKLKSNFVRPVQIAYRGVPTPEEYYTRTTVSEFVERSLTDGCDVKVALDCPKNKDAAWSVEVDVKDYMLASNPAIAQGYSRFLMGHTGSEEGHFQSNLNKGFQIVKPTLSYFHALPQNLKSCNVPYMIGGNLEYSINNKIVQINSDDPCGEILVSYLGRRVDDEGWLLIPNEVFILKALEARVVEGFAKQDYKRAKSQNNRAFWMDMKADADKLIAKAKSKFRIKDPDEFKAIIDNIVRRRVPVNRDRVSGANVKDQYNPGRYLLG